LDRKSDRDIKDIEAFVKAMSQMDGIDYAKNVDKLLERTGVENTPEKADALKKLFS
jgi:hypothetical protein